MREECVEFHQSLSGLKIERLYKYCICISITGFLPSEGRAPELVNIIRLSNIRFCKKKKKEINDIQK